MCAGRGPEDEKMGKLKLADGPLQCPGCYTLHCYCKWENPDPKHCCGEFPHVFTGKSAGSTKRAARTAGWISHRDGTATCPKCAAILKAN